MAFMYYDSRDPAFKTPFGAIPTGQQVVFRLRLPKTCGFTQPRLLLFLADHWDTPVAYPMDYEKMTPSYNQYCCTLSPKEAALHFYCFALWDGDKEVRLCKGPDNLGGFTPDCNQLWQLTVYDRSFHTPDFLKGGILYQIFPDRFCFSGTPKQEIPYGRKLHENWYEMPDYLPNQRGEITNSDYFCGDLKGIISKLDYLEKLHVSALYLNPIFESHSNHRYNTADYRRVDPLLGTEDDFRELCEKAGKRGIKIILDGVFSHTGDDSIYFNRKNRYPSPGAYHSKESPYYPWYHFNQWPDSYDCWWGFDTLPNVDETNPAYLEFICGDQGVLRYWLSLGASGFRLDVADELPDVFLDALFRCVKSYNPQALVLGEVWEDASNKIAYGRRRHYLLGHQMDSVMNYPFKNAILNFIRYGDGDALCDTVLDLLENYPKPVIDVLMNPLSTHDVERAITALVGEPLANHDRQWQMDHHFLSAQTYDLGRTLFQLAQVLQFFLPGVPSIYYGDEIGMCGYRDPFNRCTFPWNAGDRALLSFTRDLGKIHSDLRELLAKADFVPVAALPNLFAFCRITPSGEGILVAVNRGESSQKLQSPYPLRPLLGSYANGELAGRSFLVASILSHPQR